MEIIEDNNSSQELKKGESDIEDDIDDFDDAEVDVPENWVQ